MSLIVVHAYQGLIAPTVLSALTTLLVTAHPVLLYTQQLLQPFSLLLTLFSQLMKEFGTD